MTTQAFGQPLRRNEDARLLTGRGRYVADVRLPGLLLAAALDLLTLRRVPTLRVRTGILAGLLTYYRGVARTGSWLSPRARANQS